MSRTQPIVRKSVAAVALALAVGSICTVAVRAQEHMMGGQKMTLTADEQKMVMEHMEKAKAMAADPEKAEKMTMEMAKMMVMGHMAMAIASDPKVMEAHMAAMNDPNVKKVHEDAMKMSMDPAQMEKIKAEVMADPQAMKVVMHQAEAMQMMHDKMGDGGEKMMDKMHGEMDKK